MYSKYCFKLIFKLFDFETVSYLLARSTSTESKFLDLFGLDAKKMFDQMAGNLNHEKNVVSFVVLLQQKQPF